MQRIDESRLENDLAYRVGYTTEFIGFGPEDIATLHASAALLAPLVPGLVDAVYVKLFSYDATKRHFVPRQFGYEGDVPVDVASLELNHPMIAFRKQHLGRYLEALVTRPYDSKMLGYLDMVGKMHTPKAGSKDLNVPLVQMNVLMGFVADAVLSTVLSLGLDRATEVKALRAFNKVLWVQNDLITRHYQGSTSTAAA
ncbi:protoglobin family protein [Anatilimnocola sp. NA78]|uniref:protoglobin family protein n=1 Tax=Anatilimnocola sp. NA78 TaxID=3415683 RepID=UPI003CE44DC2